MLVLQAGPTAPVIWPRAAIHDTVAAIVRQPAYRRDIGRTLLDRILGWIGDAYERLSQAVSGMPHGRLIATVAAAVVVLLVVARIAYAARLRVPTAEATRGSRARGTSSSDPWDEAQRLAAGGQFTPAAHALYRAALVMLASRGLVRLHESKTSGDYARELRRRSSSSYGPFRRFGARFDRIIYGAGECTPSDYQALLDDARALAPAMERAA
jgi:hypothetical protein